jgi:hypothetical protein
MAIDEILYKRKVKLPVMSDKKKIPSPIEFILHTPLYEEFYWQTGDTWDVIALKYFKGTLDSYCPTCGKDSTFRGITPEPPNEHVRDLGLEARYKTIGQQPKVPHVNSGVFEVTLQCTRNNLHHQNYIFLIRETRKIEDKQVLRHRFLVKIGQHPSYADLNLSSIKTYKSVLNEDLLREFSRALGLASHDVGVGAYVYLRRIFEALVEDAHEEAKKNNTWLEENYIKSRMSEKIILLKDHLPNFLVENPSMYSLLSKGIHELTEKECLDHFETLKIGIELILDEKLERKEKEQKIEKARKAIQHATEKVGK